MTQHEYLLTGDFQHASFSQLTNDLGDRALQLPLKRLWRFTEQCKSRFRLVVVAENSRGSIRATDVELIGRALPLARIVIVQSDWCVGKKLPTQILPGVIYVSIQKWPFFFASQIADHSRSQLYDLPQTANDIERLQFSNNAFNWALDDISIGIISDSFSDYDSLKQLIQQAGGSSIWLSSKSKTRTCNGVDCIIHIVNGSRSNYGELTEARRQFPSTPVISIMNFPRLTDRDLAQEHGAQLIISQPFQLDELISGVKLVVRQGADAALDSVDLELR